MGSAGAWRQHDVLRLNGFYFRDRYLVIAANYNLSSQFPQVLDEVVREGVVVIEDEHHRTNPIRQVTSSRLARHLRRCDSGTRNLYRALKIRFILTHPTQKVILTGLFFGVGYSWPKLDRKSERRGDLRCGCPFLLLIAKMDRKKKPPKLAM